MVRLLTVEHLQSPQRARRRSVTAASAAAVIAMSLGLLAPTGVVAQIAPTGDDNVTLPQHVCVQDTPMLQSAIYGSHSLNETSMVAGEELTPDYVQDAISAWAMGADYWTYPNTCASGGIYMCTTYTQMIWAQTTDIGCAYKYCPSLPYKYYWVCNYGVGGSVQGQSPYVKQTDLTQTAACTRARTSSQSRVMQPKSFDASKYAVLSSPVTQDMLNAVSADTAKGVAMPAEGADMAGFEEPPKTAKKSLAQKLREAKDKAKAAVGEDAKPGKLEL